MTFPMVRSRRSSGAKDAANGTTTWAPAEQKPTATAAVGKNGAEEETATPASATAAQISVVRIQPPVLDAVGKRDDQQQPGAIPKLGECYDQAGEVCAQPQFGAIRSISGWA